MLAQSRILHPLRINLPWGHLAQWLVLSTLTACAGTSPQAQIGASYQVEEDMDQEAQSLPASTQAPKSAKAKPTTTSVANSDGDLAPKQESTTPLEKEDKEASLARAVLRNADPDGNQLGLVFAISERSSDLYWILAVENRSGHSVRLAALPRLLKFEVSEPVTQELESENTQVSTSKKTTPVTCGGDSLPKSVKESDTIELGSGELLLHAFDPRKFCKDSAVLQAGATISPSYGFPIKTKKVWRSGKLTEIEAAQKSPFVARRPNEEGEEFVPLKQLSGEAFVLGPTYPLEELNPFAPGNDEANDSHEKGVAQQRTSPPPPPIFLTVSSLGTSSAPNTKDVSLRIVNNSGKSLKLFVRRELITYEVSGPTHSFSCRMHPSDRHPMSSEFLSISSGGSTRLKTRLAEACPPGVWKEPGVYSISARFDATSTGMEFGLNAFVGTLLTRKPARLTLSGAKADELPAMRVVSAKSPR